uniref:Uncharacterized protein n=1 Tax=Glossina palpalis gambiensis TaxID=67801 RepID=A0A1B0ARN1_9MUSC
MLAGLSSAKRICGEIASPSCMCCDARSTSKQANCSRAMRTASSLAYGLSGSKTLLINTETMLVSSSWNGAGGAPINLFPSPLSKLTIKHVIILRLPPPNLPKTRKATKGALSGLRKVFQRACIRAARTGCI